MTKRTIGECLESLERVEAVLPTGHLPTVPELERLRARARVSAALGWDPTQDWAAYCVVMGMPPQKRTAPSTEVADLLEQLEAAQKRQAKLAYG